MKKLMGILVAVVIILSVSTISISAYAATPTASKISISRKINFKQLHFIHIMRVVERKEATCKSNGYIKYKCYKCSRTTQTILKSKQHKAVIDNAVPASCTESGLTEGSHCSVCGIVIKKQNIIKPNGHKVVIDNEIPATCTECGLTRGSHCSVCGTVIEEQKSIAPLGHEIVIDEKIEKTCFTDGLSEGSHCSRCGEILKAQNVLKARGQHGSTYVNVIAPATPEKDGEYQMVCVDCDEVVHTWVSTKPAYIRLYEDNGNRKTYKTDYAYTGRHIEPRVKVYNAEGNEIFDNNYEVIYSDNVKPGTAKVTINFNGGWYGIFEGTMETTFEIYDEKSESENTTSPNTENEQPTSYDDSLTVPVITELKNGDFKNTFAIYFSRVKGYTTYDVEYATNPYFSNAVRKRLKNCDTFEYTNIKIDVSDNAPQKQETYYVRIRAVDLENDYATDWSSVDTVTITISGGYW